MRLGKWDISNASPETIELLATAKRYLNLVALYKNWRPLVGSRRASRRETALPIQICLMILSKNVAERLQALEVSPIRIIGNAWSGFDICD